MSKSRQWATLTAVVCLAVLAAGWFLVIKPQRAHASQLRTQADGVKAQSAQLQTEVAQLRQQQKDLPAQQKLLSQIATKIPDNPALPSLIRQLSAAADGAGVNLVSLAPGQPTIASVGAAAKSTSTSTSASASASTATSKSTSASATGTARRPAAAAASPLANIPLTVSVQGSYFNVEQFFSAVESLNRAMLVTGFSLAPANGSSAPAGPSAPSTGSTASLPPGTLNAQITAQVFESPQITPAAATVPTSATTTGH